MFSDMIHALRQNHLPEAAPLKARLRAAVVKKMAILRQPYLFWPQDTKINPPARHLLWAAVLLLDKENFELAGDILVMEMLESADARHLSDPATLRPQLINAELDELISIVSDHNLKTQLLEKISTIQQVPHH
ncbi:MAG: hypothetical protein KKC76_00750 [Proteobacteria bacterium]|nr:hypothetical protein [Pseudomonadota bacterium]MBU4297062.1 hypothetical protein [Pseudomonadota bacterium]MCG2749943.1 hypothetical protein [Desulfobulbaceae bacterium]